LNVNFPKLKESEIKGIRICRQAKALWVEKFDKRKTPQGKDYYWLAGEFVNQDKEKIPMNGRYKMISYRLYQCNLT
jgi:5'-nucleotidase